MLNTTTTLEVSAFSTLSIVDLEVVFGGADSPSTSTTTTNINPVLSCPAGTSPRFSSTTGGGSVEGHGPAVGGSAGGGGSSVSFSCDPIKSATPSTSGE